MRHAKLSLARRGPSTHEKARVHGGASRGGGVADFGAGAAAAPGTPAAAALALEKPAIPIVFSTSPTRPAKASSGASRGCQTMLLQVPAGQQYDHLVAPCRAARSSQCVRLRLTGSDAPWSMEVASAGRVSAGELLRRVDIRGLDDAGLRACITEAAPGGRAQACAGGSDFINAIDPDWTYWTRSPLVSSRQLIDTRDFR